MSWNYLFGGLALQSAIPLSGLRADPGGAAPAGHVAIEAEIGPGPEPERDYFAWPGRYRLTLGEHQGRWLIRSAFEGAFLIERDGSAIRIFCDRLPLRQELSEVLLRRVLPRLPILFGATALHAAALAKDGGAVLVLGHSGAGKSTLCAALAHLDGWQVLGDDISLLWGGERPVIAAGGSGVCVWPASREGLALPPDRCTPMIGYEGKVRFHPADADAPPRTPLRALVFPVRSSEVAEPRLEPLALAEGVAATVPHLVQFNPNGISSAERVASLGQVTAAVRAAPAWRLVYPARFAGLAAVPVTFRELIAE